MDRGLTYLFRLMSVSCIFMGTGCEKPDSAVDPSEEAEKMVMEEVSSEVTDTAFED